MKYLVKYEMWICVILWICMHAISERCKFPRDWKGRWFQSGLGQVVIRPNKISRKGSCYQHHRDYFLVENKEEGCFQCLLIMKRHKNIIQYKESFCMAKDSLKNICRHIQVEAILYTLVRDPSSSSKCPFEDAYYFNYNDNAAGFCDNPISYMKPCVGHEQYQLHFKHCKSYAFMNNMDLRYECIATWKDGSDMYLYAKMSGSSIHTKDDSYRCFKYDFYGPEVHMSMSFDATCRGLRSATDGPFVMKFSKDLYGWPQPACTFPSWLSTKTWRDLEGKHIYSLDERGSVLSEFQQHSKRSSLKAEFRCVEKMNDMRRDGEATIMTYSTHNCQSKYQCIMIQRKKDGVIEISFGKLEDYKTNSLCSSSTEFEDVSLLISDAAHQPERCPLPGQYDISEPDKHCMHSLVVGCENPHTMVVEASCDIGTVIEIECAWFWNEYDKTYIIGKSPASNTSLYNCFSFRHRGDVMEFTTEKTYSKGLPTLFPRALKFTIQGRRVKCDVKVDRKTEKFNQMNEILLPDILHTTPSVQSSTAQHDQYIIPQIHTNAPDSPEILDSSSNEANIDDGYKTAGNTYKDIFIDVSPDNRYKPKNEKSDHWPDDNNEIGVNHIILDGYIENSDLSNDGRGNDRQNRKEVKQLKQSDSDIYNDLEKADGREEQDNSLVAMDQSQGVNLGHAGGQGQPHSQSSSTLFSINAVVLLVCNYICQCIV